MAEVKCPMCGKPNPASAEVCEFCEARLKPLILGSPASSDPSDLLAGLRQDAESGSQESVSNEPLASDDDGTDWLSRIRSRHQLDTPSQETPAGDGETISDWLAGLQQDSEAAPAPTADDGLSRLFGEPSPPAQAEVPAENDDTLGWLSAFQGDQTADAGLEQPSNLEPAPTGGDDDLGWLAGLGQFSGSEPSSGLVEPAGLEPAPASSDDNVDWLAGLGQFSGSEPPSGLVEPAGLEPAPASSDDNVDWLAGLGQFSGSEPPSGLVEPTGLDEQISPEPTPVNGDDLGWLSAFQDQQPAAETPPEPAFDLAGLMDLGNDIPSIQTPSAPQVTDFSEIEKTEILQPAPDALPDWLMKLQEAPEAAEPASPPAQPEQPDWLRSMLGEASDAETPAGPFTVPVSEEPGLPVADSNALILPNQGIPDWLADLPREPVAQTPSAPAFLSDDQLTPPPPEATTALFGAQDIPDWIGQEEAGEKTAEAEEPSAEPLEPAQLPTWLQTMRPVEAVAPSSAAATADDNRVEKAGPLAGLRGLINGSETVTQYRKPPIYSIKLQVSERQRLHATLLENILAVENQPSAPTKETRLSSQRILRAAVTLLLLAALLIPLVLGWGAVLPVRNANSLAGFTAAMGTIQSDDPILLAVEYDPGLAAELEGASAELLQWLAQNNLQISLISTHPAGPVLGEALLASSSEWTLEKIKASSANLGYIAGGGTALAQLASASLSGSVNLERLAGNPYRPNETWQNPVQLNQFKAVILLTDNVETGRAWVEQISPALGETPLLIVSSAQAAPVLQAYTGAQVHALITGSTQVTTGRTAAFQIGMLLTAMLILIGGVVQGITTLFSRSKKPREE